MPYKDSVVRRKARREKYWRDRDKVLSYEAGRRARSPHLFRQTKLKHRYGITHDDYQRMYEAQGGKCALCRDRPPRDVDHDHETGAVRGLLCRSCNIGLGLFCDSAERLEAAIAYLKPKLSGKDRT